MSETRSGNGQWVADDLALVEAMANELEAYIIDGHVYRTLLVATANGNRKITMSGGDILARLKRLQEQKGALAADQQSRLTKVKSSVDSTIYSLRTRFHDILRRELKARRDQLNWNEELRRERDDEQADPAEIQNRHHIEAIQAELNAA
ncbi:MAG: hypothetical protein R3E79_13740 [Caldilineaceae bacterium]